MNRRPDKGTGLTNWNATEDDLDKMVLDLHDTAEVEQFMREFKERLKERFDQMDIWIVAFPIRII